MRKIQSPTEIERVRRRNNIILGAVMILVLVASTAGFSLMSSDHNSSDDENFVDENGLTFFRQNGIWNVNVGEQTFGFQNLPSEVDDVDVNMSAQLNQYYQQPLYFVDPSEGTSDILMNIGNYILRYQEACFENDSLQYCGEDLPIKDCSSNLIIFETSNETRVYQKDNCVFIEGDSVRGSDAFLYKLLGITY